LKLLHRTMEEQIQQEDGDEYMSPEQVDWKLLYANFGCKADIYNYVKKMLVSLFNF
jgi:hypothetical protein